jgi:hypothetical protein
MIELASPVPCDAESSRKAEEGEVVEIPLLLPDWQVQALEKAALARGLSAAALVRSLIRDFITADGRPRGAPRG